MEGVQRVYTTGISYTKQRYIPSTWGSVLYIVLYTVAVFYITEILLKGYITRWLYFGSVVMILAWVYEGSVTERDLIGTQ
jgi:hypothetical protein